jgi:simple sugar transport system substrate-binding protein
MRPKTFLAAVIATVVMGTSAFAANIAVVGGKADDPFFAVIKKGVDDGALAVKKNGGSVSFLQMQTYDNLGPDAAQLVRTAMSQGVDGIAVPDWVRPRHWA